MTASFMCYPRGHEFEFKWLYPSQVKFDPLYQRELETKRVDKIAKAFCGDLFSEPKVSWRDGAFWCFDGQHRIAVWKKIHNNEDKLIYCKVFRGMTWSDECEAFVAQNGLSKDPTTTQKLRAQFNVGAKDVVDMVKKAEQCGFIVDFRAIQHPRRIYAVSALYRAYKSLTPETYLEMLNVIKDAWDGDRDALSAQILTGMAAIFRVFYGSFKCSDLAASMRKTSPKAIIRNGKESGKRNAYACEILKIYNVKRSKNRLDESKL